MSPRRWYRRRDSNPHNTQFLRLRPLPVGPRRHDLAGASRKHVPEGTRWSVQEDSNLQSLRPERSALARLSHAQMHRRKRRSGPVGSRTRSLCLQGRWLPSETSPYRECGAQGSHLPPPARHAGAVARLPAPRCSCRRLISCLDYFVDHLRIERSAGSVSESPG